MTGIALVFGMLTGGCANQSQPHAQTAPSPLERSAASEHPMAGYYRVVHGDTVASIAAAYGRSATDIANWNGIAANEVLKAGDTLRVGPPQTPTNAPPVRDAQRSDQTRCRPGALSWPIKGPVLTNFHIDGAKAIKIGGAQGETVRAADAGRVVYTGDQIKGYGLLVIVKHSDRYLTAYGYNRQVLVNEGIDVKRGQPIALMGDPSSPEPSLLFEVRKDRQPVDPMQYLSDCAP